jgi:hypothetical protein
VTTPGRQAAIELLCESAFIAGVGPSLTWREWLDINREAIERVLAEQPREERETQDLERVPSDDAVVPSDACKQGAPRLNGPSGSPTRRFDDCAMEVARDAIGNLAGNHHATTCDCYEVAVRAYLSAAEQPRGEEERLRAELCRLFIDGDQWHQDGPEYRLVNLLEALEVVPDTGDWHAEVKSLLTRLLAALPNRKPLKPNRSAADQLAALTTERHRTQVAEGERDEARAKVELLREALLKAVGAIESLLCAYKPDARRREAEALLAQFHAASQEETMDR